MKKQLALLACLAATPVEAAEYNLFNPVPDGKLRAMSTERPSKTDSIYTVDAGRFLLESSLVSYTHNNDCINGSCVKTDHTVFGQTTNLRIGLAPSWDLQIIVDPYRNLRVEDRATGVVDKRDGFGDTVLRLKYNVMGNEGGDGFALLPYIKLPTNQNDLGNDDVEGGFGIPFVFNLKDGWSIGGMTQFNALKEQTPNPDYYLAYANALIVGKNFTDKLSGYAEYYTYRADTDGAEWQNTTDFGIGYAVNDNFRIDTGVNIGVTNAADDLNWFVGGAYRF
ncbi:MAG: transporter [Proteobacteria bacterium]|nr:transporter [Pseudomonadota bacterium]